MSSNHVISVFKTIFHHQSQQSLIDVYNFFKLLRDTLSIVS